MTVLAQGLPDDRATNGEVRRASPVPSATGISASILRVTHQIERWVHLHLATYDLPPGMTLNRMWALMQLFQQEQQGCLTRMSDFAEVLGISARSVTTVVDVLESQGLLQRRADPADRRVTLLEMTAQAVSLMPEFERVMQDVGEHMCASLPEAERRELLRLLGKLFRQEPGIP